MPHVETIPSTTEGTGRRLGLHRADVVNAALELVETEGAQALTMRRLAAALDVTTTTIYWHVGSRDELIVGLVELQSQRQARIRVRGTTPSDRIWSVCRQIWQSALVHRDVTSLAHQAGAASLLELPLEQVLIKEFESAGVSGAPAARALRSILATIGGFLVLALRDESTIPEPQRHESLWASVDDDSIHPATIAALSIVPDLDELVASTLRSIIDSYLPTPNQPTGDIT